ncbi:AfsR/SARP family transcriptional regulator [Kitasatospora sp. NPDC088346]|uniref:AfsR/SARP family transcriptional regulator n=1 Tax=Kitasatospora sp. NPDC088346 TaxID=3364073 RepID=UPI003828D29A
MTDEEWGIQLLGPLRVQVGGQQLDLSGPRQEKVLAVLALDAGRVVPFDTLVDALWDDAPPDTARRQVHNAIATLRRCLGPLRDLIVTDGRGYRADLGAAGGRERVDAHRFLCLVRSAETALAGGRRAEAVTALGDALALWNGPALAGLDGRAVRILAGRLDEQRLTALERLFELRLDGDAPGELVPALAELVATHPLRDPFRRQLMLALHRAGRQADALEVYEQGRALLAADLGLDTRAELRLLHERILRCDPALDRPADATPPATPPADPPAPPHADPPAAPRAGTAGPAPATPPRAGVFRAHQRRFLPYDVTDFTGRGEEFHRLVALAEHASAPDGPDGTGSSTLVVTAVDGMAGIGKTTIAVRAAHALADRYPDGQLFVDLHGHTPGQEPITPAAALDRLLRHLGVSPERIPDGVDQRAAAWRAALAGQRVLIVLDNARDVGHVRPLLPGTGSALVLITSRRRLTALDGAVNLSLEVLTPKDAVELFVRIVGAERAEGRRAEVADVVALCGCLPLAIRIAASRLRHRPAWSVAHLADRLRDRQRRLAELVAGDRSVAAAFEVSYLQLGEAQQRLFRLLGLHPGHDFDAVGAAVLNGCTVAEAEVMLEELFDTHLLGQHTVGRYYFHDLIRQYALTKAEHEEQQAGREQALRRLRRHYLDLAGCVAELSDPGRPAGRAPEAPRAIPGLRTVADAADLLAAERANIVAVLACAPGAEDLEQVWRLAVAVGPLLVRNGYVEEAMTGYRHALDAARAAEDLRGQAEVQTNLGLAYRALGRYDGAVRALQTALELSRTTGDRYGEARTLWTLGHVGLLRGDYPTVLQQYRAALEIFEQVGAARDQAAVLGNIGVVYGYLAEYRQALAHHRRALELSRELDNPFREAVDLLNVGWVLSRLDDTEEAWSCLEEALARTRELGAREVEAQARWAFGDLLHHRGDQAAALERAREALVLAREIGSRDVESQTLNLIGSVHRALGSPESARECHERALALASELGLRFEQGVACEGLARLALDAGEPQEAAVHCDRAVALFARMHPHRADLLRADLARERRPEPSGAL